MACNFMKNVLLFFDIRFLILRFYSRINERLKSNKQELFKEKWRLKFPYTSQLYSALQQNNYFHIFSRERERFEREALFLSRLGNDRGIFLNLRYQDMMNLSQNTKE